MPNFRRSFVEGGTYFFTLVTHERRPMLTTELGRQVLREAIQSEQAHSSIELVASVLLPDHLHMIWTLPNGDDDYPRRWQRIKSEFSRQYLRRGGTEVEVSDGRKKKGDRGIWQARYWEHTIRDSDDFDRCLDYIHWNPVKHGYVSTPSQYPWSTFQTFVDLGVYDINWGTGRVVAEVPGAEWD